MNKHTYIDIYSHSSTKTRNFKSRGKIKSILCFSFCLLLFLSTFGFYFLGATVEKHKKKTDPIDISGAVQQSQSSAYNKNISEASKCIVGIYVYNDVNSCYGSGIVVSQDGYIATSDHIFKNIFSPKILVCDEKGEYISAAFIGGDKKSDIAVIKIEKTGMQFANISTVEAKANVGETVYAIGCPMNKSLSKSVTSGILSGKDRRYVDEHGKRSLKSLQTDAPINPGSSGGGLFNAKGTLIGMNTSKVVDESYEGIAFAVPTETLKEVVSSLIEKGTVSNRSQLGVNYTTLDYETAIMQRKSCGLLITGVSVNSSLYGMGITQGDIIISIDGKKITGEEVFLDEIEKLQPGDSVELTFAKEQYKEYKLTATLIEEKSQTSYIG